MPVIDPEKINYAKTVFKREKIITLKKLVSIMGCSSRTAQKKLKLWNAYTSYNQNGMYYTLPEIPKFNAHGIWHFNNIAFSIHGNLKKTIIHLVSVSDAGLAGKQLGVILGLSPQSFLHHFRICPGIYREKYEGVFVYFSDTGELYEKQVNQRKALIRQRSIDTISDLEAVMILVAIIRDHGISAEEISALPEIKKSKVRPANIQGFMEHHGLLKKNLNSKP